MLESIKAAGVNQGGTDIVLIPHAHPDSIREKIRFVDFEKPEKEIVQGVFGAKAPGCTPSHMVAEEKSLITGQHFPPFPGLGHVAKRGEGQESYTLSCPPRFLNE